MKKNVVKLALVSAALIAAPITWGVVNAQTNPTAPAATATQQAVNYASSFISKLATALGVTEEKLDASIKSAGTATVDEALKKPGHHESASRRVESGHCGGTQPVPRR